MIIRTNCHNPQCLAKKSMIPVSTKIFYLIKREFEKFNSIQKKEYRTWKSQTLFYICKKCGFMSDFKSNDLRGGGLFWICLVPKDDESKIDKVKSMKKPSCVYCGLSIFPANPQKNEITQNNIVKLWLKGKFFGYYCKVHQLAFCKKNEEVAWDNINEQYIGTGTFNVLGPLNSSFPKSVREKDPRYNEKRELLIQYVEFEKIGGFAPTIDIDDSPNNHTQYVGVNVPQNKIKKFHKWLQKHNCEVVR